MGRSVVAREGNVLSFRERRSGLRAYVAFAGGIDVPPVLGSRSTDLLAGFGGHEGRALRDGDRLALGRAGLAREDAGARAAATPPPLRALRVVLGPQDDMFTDEAHARLSSESFAVSPLSDRMGCRLSGPPLTHRQAGEMLSDGMIPGCIQVPRDGQPIVALADSGTTGGYAKIATVVRADLPRLAQLVPGDQVRFEVVRVEEAQRAAHAALRA
jgi:biotin-dependent carboxylase-like uncharacterized protein